MKLFTFFSASILALLFFTAPCRVETASADPRPAVDLIRELGCRGCHVIGDQGGQLASDLTEIGSRMTTAQIKAALSGHTQNRQDFMPRYSSLSEQELEMISAYLYQLK